MREQFFKILFLTFISFLLVNTLSGQRKVIVDDIYGMDGDTITTYNVEGSSFELLITSYEHGFTFAKVELYEEFGGQVPLSAYFFKPYDGDVEVDYFIGNLERGTSYLIDIVFYYRNRPITVKTIRIVKIE